MPKKSIEDYQAKLEEYKKQQEKQKEVQQKEIKLEEQKQNLQPKTEISKESTSNVTEKQTEQIGEKKEATIQQTNPTQQKIQQISTYNGGKTEKYSWSQSINDVTIQVDLPQGTKARNLLVEIKSNSLKVIIKSENKELINGEFYDKVKIDDSIWQVEDQKSLLITLEKAQENIWKSVIKGDEEIDTTKVDNSKKLEEFDPETQGALRKIMYEQQRKQMGLPTTEEEEQQELLKKAWDAEGSPFKGQPFDPSKLNLPQGQNFNLPPQN